MPLEGEHPEARMGPGRHTLQTCAGGVAANVQAAILVAAKVAV